ncbi:MAG TPA: hypothetical protein VKB80_19140 [Kofleriaceae bacterium]|nr:hypothetical protein [Kofleriaceae bacterium]
MSWPVRTRICLECRAALSDGEHCTWVRHTAVAPADPAGRRRLIEAVWRESTPRGGRPSLGAELARFLAGLIAAARPGSASTSPVVAVPAPLRWGADRGPFGASEEPLWTARARYTGRASAAAAAAPSPIAGTPCLAYGLWLLDRWADGSPARWGAGARRAEVLLRDGACLDFEVELDDGRVARVPAGTAELVAPGARLRRDQPGLARYLEHLAVADPAGDSPAHLPFREVGEAVLRPGDAVALLVDLQPVPDARQAGSPYREASVGALVPVGRICIEIR